MHMSAIKKIKKPCENCLSNQQYYTQVTLKLWKIWIFYWLLTSLLAINFNWNAMLASFTQCGVMSQLWIVSFGIVSHPNSDSKVGCAIVFGCNACLLLDLMGVWVSGCQLFIVLLYANVKGFTWQLVGNFCPVGSTIWWRFFVTD
jgi:hypothetical protein